MHKHQIKNKGAHSKVLREVCQVYVERKGDSGALDLQVAARLVIAVRRQVNERLARW
ncbi:MAG: hypothetical protein GXZ10_06070 [Gammaproteobacteria bacterium]|nr:hypothetical protein [Gammaproteobacteria bacterium]